MRILFALAFCCTLMSGGVSSWAGEKISPQSSSPSSRADAALQNFTISRKGDLELSCTELYHEAQAMSQVISNTKKIKDDSKMQSQGVSAAGAVGSFLVGSVTGGIGLAAAGFLLDKNIDSREEHADKIQDIAEQRQTFMMGIYTAQGCEGDIYSMISSVDETAQKTSKTEEKLSAIEPAAAAEPEHKTRQGIPRNPYNN